ncbi:unnamed protein product [Periconia digitata]|uniref:Carboxylesterase family protein n=1 Tax=Periconia digitata TaxID=1303443 RepID=A0A9W4ULR7_9PLEO|nr:unnamed protein product [Periconia digitata]
MRLTRAAMRAEAQQPDIETPDASTAPTINQSSDDRVPLSDVSGNTSLELEADDADQAPPPKMPTTKSKAKGGAKKGAKGKKGKAVKEDDAPVADTIQDEPLATGNPVDELAEQSLQIERPASPPPARSLRMTRRQLAMQEEQLSKPLEPQSSLQNESTAATNGEDTVAGSQQEIVGELKEPATKVEEETPAEQVSAESPQEANQEEAINVQEDAQQLKIVPTGMNQEPHDSEVIPTTPKHTAVTPTVEVFSEPEPKTLTSEKPCEGETTPAANRTPNRPASRSPSRSPMRLEESIEAFDALEEALENVGKAIPLFDQSADEAPGKKGLSKTPTPPKKKSPAVSRISRNPSAAPKSLKPAASRLSSGSSLGRASSVRATSSQSAKDQPTRKGSGETSDYLASKRRPISMSFPAPPPPVKSQRAPTKSTFQLPGEAVAAKLKAQKEERLKREAEAGSAKKPRPISMPPPPKSTKAPTKPNFQLPGEAIAAKLKAQKEERLKREAEAGNQQQQQRAPSSRPVSLVLPAKSTKPPTVANFQLPGEAVAAKLKAAREERLKREEQEAEAAKKAALAFKARPAPARRPIPSTTTTTAGALPKRTASMSTTTTAQSRTASTSSSFSAAAAPATGGAVSSQKGRQVFNRDKLEKEARVRERKEKEDAAKKARAEAAERGRIASREWAERQKRKLMGVMGGGKGKEGEGAS